MALSRKQSEPLCIDIGVAVSGRLMTLVGVPASTFRSLDVCAEDDVDRDE